MDYYGGTMTKTRVVVTVCALALLASAAGAQTVEQRVFPLPDLGEMRYAISIPDGDPSEPVPLILALHPGGGRTPYYGGMFMQQIVAPAVRDWNAIIVAPDCPTRAWNSDIADRAVIALLDDVLANHAIDRERILVTGFSLGGGGSWFMATHHPDLFTGAIVMAGSPRDNPLEALDEMPIAVIHSHDDEVVAFEPARRAVESLEARDHPVRFTELRGVGHYTMGNYIEPLRDAGEWIKEQWGGQ